ncbi:MAG: DUF3368 domain-containing protein [Acidobacteria bacterium]|nr:DUF3368 domain-containing protein [Acidobacteriota bacterium]MCW5969311.1 hypothetical protein [Blastocatellales bacterium]
MIVVADTTPINYLILIDREDLLKELFHRVLIPEAVARELRSVKAPAAVRTWAALPPDWLELRTVSAPANDFLPYLGDGERATIGLGLELGADLVLMDERAGREAARQRNLAVAGWRSLIRRQSVN